MGLSAPLPDAPSVPTLRSTIALWLADLRASDRSPKTIAAYEWAAGKLSAFLNDETDIKNVGRNDIVALYVALKEAGLSPASRSGVDRPLRTFFHWCVARKLLAESPLADVSKPKVTEQPMAQVTDAELAALLRTTVERSQHAFRARRDRAILLLLSSVGARPSEIADLTTSDVDLGTMTITVMGKGSKVRILPILPDAADALTLYLTRDDRAARTPPTGPVARPTRHHDGQRSGADGRPTGQGRGDRALNPPAHDAPRLHRSGHGERHARPAGHGAVRPQLAQDAPALRAGHPRSGCDDHAPSHGGDCLTAAVSVVFRDGSA